MESSGAITQNSSSGAVFDGMAVYVKSFNTMCSPYDITCDIDKKDITDEVLQELIEYEVDHYDYYEVYQEFLNNLKR